MHCNVGPWSEGPIARPQSDESVISLMVAWASYAAATDTRSFLPQVLDWTDDLPTCPNSLSLLALTDQFVWCRYEVFLLWAGLPPAIQWLYGPLAISPGLTRIPLGSRWSG